MASGLSCRRASTNTVYEELRCGRIVSVRMGRRILIPKHALAVSEPGSEQMEPVATQDLARLTISVARWPGCSNTIANGTVADARQANGDPGRLSSSDLASAGTQASPGLACLHNSGGTPHERFC